jgi:hypothetical protein
MTAVLRQDPEYLRLATALRRAREETAEFGAKLRTMRTMRGTSAKLRTMRGFFVPISQGRGATTSRPFARKGQGGY